MFSSAYMRRRSTRDIQMDGQVQGNGMGDTRDVDSPGVLQTRPFVLGGALCYFACLSSTWVQGGLGIQSCLSCLVYGHVVDHSSSAILPACFQPGPKAKKRVDEGTSMHCLLSNFFSGGVARLLYWLAQALLHSSGIGIHPPIRITK